MSATYTGGCHCGAVRYEAEVDIANGTFKCNCSMCGKSRSWLASAKSFKLLSEGRTTDYQFARQHIHHLFCSTCGLKSYSWATGKDGAKSYVVNVACLDGVDPKELVNAKVTYFDGLHDNFKSPPPETRHL